ncbi:RNA polymerase sigma-70 factor [Chitinophaga sp. XS-30]|uniref:RNA polymerase sigma-70 factor n=1 Tax=Chitinophaga sp. XS-30 TaxID=2604421 RepID=UPI0011DD6753|nr:RNA polymerase sigma-70 factor [Chitinophaga sp. XS-30]QEH43248.1 RNA polymerase sigma-70 factor [Chitinophaga sp. XS-30]
MQRVEVNYQTILERLKASDLDAFDILYTHTRERLFVYALSFLKDEAAAQDVVQDLFSDFWEGKLFLDVHSGLVSYLVRAVRNRCLVILKKEQNRQKVKKLFDYTESGKVALDGQLENRELRREIEAAINKLPPMPARVFRLHYIEKLSYAEIAGMLNITPATISNHMTRALKSLRESLKKI